MRELSSDNHLEVVYSHAPLPNQPSTPSPERLMEYRRLLQQENCTFEKVAVLPSNIGYMKLNSFPDLSICQETAKSAMASLNIADSIIIDLRDNRGRNRGMVMFLAAHFFDHPQYIYNPRENTSRQSWTESPVPGNRLANKPAFLLTSPRTVSAAEQFAFNLKMLRRAIIVGETTRGSAHAGVFHRIDDHFGVAIREARPINPYGANDWEGIGVIPDVKVPEATALEHAKRLAEKGIRPQGLR